VRFDDVEVLVDHDDGVFALIGSRSWLQIDPRLWRNGDLVRSTIFHYVAPAQVVLVPKGELAVASGGLAIQQEQKAARRGLAKALAILVGVVGFVGVLALWASAHDEPKPPGHCVVVENGRATRVACSSAEARARLLATTAFDGSGARPCPTLTDDIVPMVDSVAEYGCLRRLVPPHPGDRGRGGGILRVGDCVVDPDTGPPGQEAPCGSGRDWATVAALAASPARCAPPAVDFTTRPADSSDPIVCLARGPGVMTRGDCVTDQSVTQLVEVRCGSPEAAFRVVARVAAPGRCRSHDESALVPRGLPRAAVACLRRL
jgi:hypothetical protein